MFFNSFHNNTYILFAFFCGPVDISTDYTQAKLVKTAEQKPRQWHQAILVVIVFFSTTCLQWKIMMVLHRALLCSRKRLFILLHLDL